MYLSYLMKNNMFKKILYTLIIIIVLYVLVIFIYPELAKSLWKTFWLSNFNDNIIYLKKKLDNWSIKYDTSSSNSWNTVDKAINTVVEWLDTTKEHIDNIRETAKWVEEKYNETKKVLDDVNKLWEWVSSMINTWTLK